MNHNKVIMLTLLISWRGISCLFAGSTSREFFKRHEHIIIMSIDDEEQDKTVLRTWKRVYFYFVVAMPTIKYLITTRRYNLASPLIMRTPKN